jgi:hypothetical protein
MMQDRERRRANVSTISDCGLALAQGDFLFAAIFAAASSLIIVEAMRR